MQNKPVLDIIFGCTGLAGTAISATISDVLGIVLTLINIIYLAVFLGFKIYAKIKKASEDGKITAEEAEEISKEIKEASELLDKEVKKNGKK